MRDALALVAIVDVLLVLLQSTVISAQETATSSSHTELIWTRTCAPSSYYDFTADLKFCQDGDTFGYRISDSTPCGTLAPLIRMVAGKRYKLRLKNQATETTNIHTHGLHIPGEGNGDDSIRSAEPGQWLIYNWTIPEYHMDGTYWYHPHVHKMSARQLGGGAMGLLLIDPSEASTDLRPAYLENQRKILVSDGITGRSVNGKTLETVELAVDEWHRLRFVFSASEQNFPTPIRFDDTTCQVHVVAYDGVWRSIVPKPQDEYEFNVTYASRLDFAIKCNDDSAIFFGDDGTIQLAEIVVSESGLGDVGPAESWTPQRPRYLQDLRDVPGLGDDDITYEVELTLNNVNFEPFDLSKPLNTFAYDTVQQWLLKGLTHNFHPHMYHMQVVSVGGCGNFYEEGEWYDTINLLIFEGCLVRFRFADIGGRTLMHCHITEHADDGSINWVDVQGGPEASLVDYGPKDSVPEPDEDTICPADDTPTINPMVNPTHNPTSGPTYDPTGIPTSPPSPTFPSVVPPHETATSSSHTELMWTPICAPSYYDFTADLKFCQDGDTFGYRISDSTPCGTLAPLIRMIAGKRYKLRLKNQATEITNIHTHGLHIPGEGNGDDSVRAVGPGQWLIYNWTIPEYHMDGTYWYHPHVHQMAARQLGGGAMGLLLIDPAEGEPRPAYLEKERKILVSDGITGRFVNGKTLETVELAVNEWHRLRFVFSAALENFPTPLRFDDTTCQVHVVAYDGVWRSLVPKPQDEYEFLLTYASRLDFAIKCSADSAIFFGFDGTIQLAELVVSGSGLGDVGPPESWTPQRPRYLQDLRDVPGLGDDDITFRIDVTLNSVNFEPYNLSKPLSNFTYDTVQQWSLNGLSHNFHPHIYHMQVVSTGGCASFYEEGEWYDTINLLLVQGCRVRFRLADVGGRTIMHCHITEHSDDGSINWIDVHGGPDLSFTNYNPKDSVSEPDEDTVCPSVEPTKSPTVAPTQKPINAPTNVPTYAPTYEPTNDPTNAPTNDPTIDPTVVPTLVPMAVPSDDPTNVASNDPSPVPTVAPTIIWSENPTGATLVPIVAPPVSNFSISPTFPPTKKPITKPITNPPTILPPSSQTTSNPTVAPLVPTLDPPVGLPSISPTGLPTKKPITNPPTFMAPSSNITNDPTVAPLVPTLDPPVASPSISPTSLPTKKPITNPPTFMAPSSNITNNPTVAPLVPTLALPVASSSITPTFLPTKKPITNPPTFRTPSSNTTKNPMVVQLVPTVAPPVASPSISPTSLPTKTPVINSPTLAVPSSNATTATPLVPTVAPVGRPSISPTFLPTKNPITISPESIVVPDSSTIDHPTFRPTTCDPHAPISVVLYDTRTDTPIGPLGSDIMICDKDDVGLTLVAEPSCKEKVKFKLLQEDDKIVFKNTEKVPPFSLTGDEGEDLLAMGYLAPGKYNLIINPKPGDKQSFPFRVIGCEER